jgi:general secretion pathway protein D
MRRPSLAFVAWWATLAAAALGSVGCASPKDGPSSRAEPRVMSAAPAPSAPGDPAPSAAPVPRADASGSASAAPPALPPGRYLFSFEDLGLSDLANIVSAITGKRLMVTGTLPTIHATVHSPEPVTADEAWGAFLSILQANGLTVVARGQMWAVVLSSSLINR